MRVVIIVDKLGSAIHRLALPIQTHNPHLDIQIVDIHPKRPSQDQLRRALRAIDRADIVDVHYWKSGEVIKEYIKDKKKILFHFNPYDLRKSTWDEYDMVVVGNEEMRSILPKAYLMPYSIDLDFFRFNQTYTDEPRVLMVANRIESSKGILEVAQACKEAGYIFTLVGAISDAAYFAQVKEQGVEFHEQISNEELRDIYYRSAILVCNSKDGFESGTLPILEAMACGVPILTRIVGHVPDLYNGDNMLLNQYDKEDVQHLTEKLRELMGNRDLRVKYREKAWNTVKNRYDRRMAWDISHLYQRLNKDFTVSIVIPTFDNPECVAQSLQAAIEQDYPYKEIIVVDSGNTKVEELIREIKRNTDVSIQYIAFDNYGEYTLPKARNIAVMEARGEYLMFCDERIRMNKNALSEFVKRLSHKTWLYGMKDDVRKEFVENFSLINRAELIQYGMFNERINTYGGSSEEIRKRFGMNGFIFEMVGTAQAYAVKKSSSKHSRKQQIMKAKYLIHKLYGGV